MDMARDKLLWIGNEKSNRNFPLSPEAVPGIDLLAADSENKAFELIYTHDPFLVIVDDTDMTIDMYKVGTMLLSHQKTQNIPLLIITGHMTPDASDFLSDFKLLDIDYIPKPINSQLLQKKIKIFHDLYKQKQALNQSMEELDMAYKKIVIQHQSLMEEHIAKQMQTKKTRICINQMQQILPGLNTHIHSILHHQPTPPKIKSALAGVKHSAQNMMHISNQLMDVKKATMQPDRLSGKAEKPCKIIYFQNSEEDFSIFSHSLKSVSAYELVSAETIEDGIRQITDTEFDLIFTDHTLPDGTGFDLLTRLKQNRSLVPVVFALGKSQAPIGSQAVSRGAFNFFFKEDLCGTTLITMIQSTLEKTVIKKEVEEALGRIVMIAQKDSLTHLYSPSFFKKTLTSEMDKAKRYRTHLTLLTLRFEPDGSDESDDFFATCAALVQSMIRASDIACCFQKDIFAIILPHTQMDGAKILGRRILKKIEGFDFKPSQKKEKPDISFACVSYDPSIDVDDTALIQKALDSLPAETKDKEKKHDHT